MVKEGNTCCKCIPIGTGIILIALFHAIVASFFIIDTFVIHKDFHDILYVYGIPFKSIVYVLIITEAIISILIIGVRFEKDSKIFYFLYCL